mmetsp:Transcript_1115/g.3104  ORF Transcript_1115/g.3104 Transcript_1115/m.3104 type:complete len:212 (-) Transcript_1115:715-1350(-)
MSIVRGDPSMCCHARLFGLRLWLLPYQESLITTAPTKSSSPVSDVFLVPLRLLLLPFSAPPEDLSGPVRIISSSTSVALFSFLLLPRFSPPSLFCLPSLDLSSSRLDDAVRSFFKILFKALASRVCGLAGFFIKASSPAPAKGSSLDDDFADSDSSSVPPSSSSSGKGRTALRLTRHWFPFAISITSTSTTSPSLTTSVTFMILTWSTSDT